LRQFNLKIEPGKYEFLKTERDYLGHVKSGGVKPGPEKVKTISNSLTLTNITDVKSFLGLAGYYCKFIPQFNKVAKPLTDFLRKEKSGNGTQNK
jgi:hypothetical protein